MLGYPGSIARLRLNSNQCRNAAAGAALGVAERRLAGGAGASARHRSNWHRPPRHLPADPVRRGGAPCRGGSLGP
eukprot:1873850-Pyramimonas_sp.AAC.1